MKNDELIPLVALYGQFPTDYDRTLLAYAESVSAIDYLVRTQSQETLVSLVNAYADGLTDDEAFTRALGQDLAAFQAGWLADLGATSPSSSARSPPRPGPCHRAGPGRRRRRARWARRSPRVPRRIPTPRPPAPTRRPWS